MRCNETLVRLDPHHANSGSDCYSSNDYMNTKTGSLVIPPDNTGQAKIIRCPVCLMDVWAYGGDYKMLIRIGGHKSSSGQECSVSNALYEESGLSLSYVGKLREEAKLVPTEDSSTRPNHYLVKTPYEVDKVLEAWGLNEKHYLAAAIEYIMRAQKKGTPVEDLKKAKYRIELEIDRLEHGVDEHGVIRREPSGPPEKTQQELVSELAAAVSDTPSVYNSCSMPTGEAWTKLLWEAMAQKQIAEQKH